LIIGNSFIKEIHRISQENYIPTEVDILMAQNKASGIQEYKFNMGSLDVHMSSVRGQRPERKKWIHQFENVSSMVFSVDLNGYDQILQDGSNQNQIMASLLLFDSVVNSGWFLRTSVILLLCNEGLFRRKLARSPLSKYFPDYTGGNDVAQASEYIVWRFNQLNLMQLSLFPHICEASGTQNSPRKLSGFGCLGSDILTVRFLNIQTPLIFALYL
jgi:guanine nucleotide-binding protein G(i) subunit alpha